MILQTGLRTDIPAFYTPWFLRRLEEGFVLSRSPYNPNQVTRYRLAPDVVDCIGFCTKNPAPMLPHMDKLAHFGQQWFVTITPYGEDIEPHVPPKEQVMADFRRLSDPAWPPCCRLAVRSHPADGCVYREAPPGGLRVHVRRFGGRDGYLRHLLHRPV